MIDPTVRCRRSTARPAPDATRSLVDPTRIDSGIVRRHASARTADRLDRLVRSTIHPQRCCMIGPALGTTEGDHEWEETVRATADEPRRAVPGGGIRTHVR